MSDKKTKKTAKKKVKEPVEIIGEGKRRYFVYDEHTFEDPGLSFSDQDVLDTVATSIAALAGGRIERIDRGDYVEVIFTKKPKKLG